MNVIKSKKGFTLIELMIVVAIIGILAAIAIPKFSQLITKGSEANCKGSLGAVRSALSIYYGDMEGWYPSDTLSTLTVSSKYLSVIPVAKFPTASGNNIGHADSSVVTANTSWTDGGGWVYDNTQSDTSWGRVLGNCSHSDTKGNLWTSY